MRNQQIPVVLVSIYRRILADIQPFCAAFSRYAPRLDQ